MNLINPPRLPNLEIQLSDETRRSIGALGELTAAAMLRKQGLHVEKASRRRGDLRVMNPETGEITYIEVKTARRGRDKKWRFLLWKKNKTDHRHADKVLLLAVMRWGEVVPFVVPVDVLLRQKQCVICSDPRTYTGKLACYRQARGEIRL